MCDFGRPGLLAERARSSANSMLRWNSASTSASESWKLNPPGLNEFGPSTVPPTSGPLPPVSSTV